MLRSGLILYGWLVFAGCDIPFPPPAPPPVERTLPSDDELVAQRPYRVIRPSDFDGGAPLPLLLGLHAYDSTGLGLDTRYDLTRLGELRGFLLVTPDALQEAGGTRTWHPKKETAYPFDREYLRALLLDVKQKYPVDAARVFVFGNSQGAHMAYRVACDSADLVAAVVSVAGQAPKAAADCAAVRAVSALEVHGTADTVIGYSGDLTEPIDLSIPSAHDSVATWARIDGCGALTASPRTLDLSVEVDGAETTVETYAACPSGIGVELWTMNGVSHFPAPQPNFASLVYGFMAQHPRP